MDHSAPSRTIIHGSFIIILGFFLIYPTFMTLSYNFFPEFYDFFYMNSSSLIYISTFYVTLGILLAICGLKRRFLLYAVLFFPLLFYAINYPNILFRDAYLHGRWAKIIAKDGTIDTFPDEFKAWPSSYILISLSYIITGIDLLNFNTLLALLIFSLLIMSCYCLAKRIEYDIIEGDNTEEAYNKMYLIAPFLIIAFTRSHLYEPLHFARHPFGLSLLLLLVFIFWRHQTERGWNNTLALLVIFITLVTTHPLFSIYGVLTIIFSYIIDIISSKIRKEKHKSSVFMPILAAVLFVGWLIYSADFSLSKLPVLVSYALNPQTLSETSSLITFNVFEEIPWYGLIMRECYKLLLITLGVLSILSLMHSETCKSPIFALLLTIIIIMPLQKSIGYIGGGIFNRVYTFLAVTFSFLVPRGLRNMFKMFEFLRLRKQPVNIIRRISIAALISIALLSTNILTFEYNYYTNMLRLGSTICMSNFLMETNIDLNIATRNFGLYYVYFDPNANIILCPSLSASKDIKIKNDMIKAILSSNLFIISAHEYGEKLGFAPSLRETWLFWQSIKKEIEQIPNTLKCYDNGLGDIYCLRRQLWST